MLLSRIRPSREKGRRAPVPDLQDAYAGHQFLWRFFADHPDRRRDFVYRTDVTDEGPDFLVASERPPRSPDGSWIVESKSYDITLPAGTRLGFSLRANPTQRDRSGGSDGGARHDVVMVEKRRLRAQGKESHAPDIIQEAGVRWLDSRAERFGFTLVQDRVRAEGYQQWRFRKGSGVVTVSGIDYAGLLEVTDPLKFKEAMHRGIGPAKGFGFGLLLVRRA